MLLALQHIHSSDIIHKDIQPESIYVGQEDVKLVDFKFAQFKTDITANGRMFYLAPEILKGDKPSVAADVWSSGVLLYQMLTGNLPFEGFSIDDAGQIEEKSVNEVITQI